MPRKRVSEKEIVLSTPVPARHKPATAKRANRPAAMIEEVSVTQVMPVNPAQAEIAALAYSYWEARGCQGGSPEADWLRAEQELSAKLTAAAIA